ncbi:MAG TPA: hypothetical protein VE377_26840 [Candidatus Dormibacteraeota bacterium]|nr:hypothetical protein [Candidatus Dormibacteraeota bacterium]
MGRFRSSGLCLAVTILSLGSISGCGGGSKPGSPLFPGRISLSPASNASLTLGGILTFSASVQTASGTTLNTPVTFSSNDTSILTLAPNGVACAGQWDVAFTTCTPGNVGPVTVTASALGGNSVPTYVFVHPPIDNITVTGVLLDGLPVQEPCLSQTQSMTVEAHAYSQGNDITASVGPFNWSANNPGVVSLTPLVNSAFNFPTNQATAKAVNPGITYIYATASGVSSTSFQQPQLTNAQGGGSPVLDFFATCAIQDIALELGAAGSGQTSFATTKSGAGPTVVATLVDIMGNSSLPNTHGGIVLGKIPLTWTSSQPQVISVSASCTESCTLGIPSAGSATVTASCSPPICNIGFPLVPASLSTQQKIDDCTNFYHALFPQFTSCQQLIPVPVYASPVFVTPPNTQTPLSPMAAISGVVTGTSSSVSVLAASTGCANSPPAVCNSSVYYLSTSKASPGNENPLPTSPNSLLFSLAGDRILMGSDFGSQIINPASFGTTNNPFTSLGTVTGRVLGISATGTFAAFSDTIHTPNQVYIVNTGNPASPTALNIPSATIAGFSPDTLKTFIIGGSTGNSLYVYSPAQALQGPISLAGPGRGIAFSPNGAFAFIPEAGAGGSANLTAFATCTNAAISPIQPAASVDLPADPILMKVLPAVHIDGRDSFGNLIPDGIHVLVLDATGFDIVTSTISPPANPATLCPQQLAFDSVQRIELNAGTISAGTYVNFFASADGTQLYLANGTTSSILVYSLIAGSVTGGIELQNNATPITADMSVDAGTILISGSDGMLHEVSTAVGGADAIPLSFPSLPNGVNAFCTTDPSTGPCTLNVALAKP